MALRPGVLPFACAQAPAAIALAGGAAPSASQRDVLPPAACPVCHEARWWRIPPTGPWVCGACHPPTVGRRVEWLEVDGK